MVSSSFMSLYAWRGTILTLSQRSGNLDGPTDLQAEATDFQIKSPLCCPLVSVLPNKSCRRSLFQSCGFETPILIITYFSSSHFSVDLGISLHSWNIFVPGLEFSSPVQLLLLFSETCSPDIQLIKTQLPYSWFFMTLSSELFSDLLHISNPELSRDWTTSEAMIEHFSVSMTSCLFTRFAK